MRAALRAGHRMDLVDDHGADAAEHAPAADGREHDMQRLGRRDENVRRLPNHPRARRCGRIARSHRDPDFRKALAGRGESIAQLREWSLEVALDVVVERLEWRDVENLHRIAERLAQAVDNELIELP